MTSKTSDLDEWMLKLDNLQKALQSHTSQKQQPIQPRKLVIDHYGRRTDAQNHNKSQNLINHWNFNSYSYENSSNVINKNAHTNESFTPIMKKRPIPPTRHAFVDHKNFPNKLNGFSNTSNQDSFISNRNKRTEVTSPVDSTENENLKYHSSQKFKFGNNTNNNHVESSKINNKPLAVNHKSVRWSSGPYKGNLTNGSKNHFNEMDIVESEPFSVAKSNCNQNNYLVHNKAFTKPAHITNISSFGNNLSLFENKYKTDMKPDPSGQRMYAVENRQSMGMDKCLPAVENTLTLSKQQSHKFENNNFVQDSQTDPIIDVNSPQTHLNTHSLYTSSTAEVNSDCCLDNLAFWKGTQLNGLNKSLDNVDNSINDETKMILRIHQADRTTKAISVNSKSTAIDVILNMAAKNFLPITTKYSLVEKVPSMKLERCFEDDDFVRNCILSWPSYDENLIFFEEREDSYGIFENPKVWLGNPFSDSSGQITNSIILDLLEPDGVNRLPPFRDFLYILQRTGRWKRRFCTLRSSGMYAAKRQNSAISDFIRVAIFTPDMHLYSTSGGWKKDNSPTPFGFVLKPYSVTTMNASLIRAFCATTEESLRTWCSLIRIIQMGPRLLSNFHQRITACTLNYHLQEDSARSNTNLISMINNRSNIADMVRKKFEKDNYLQMDLKNSAKVFARVPAIIRARSLSQIQQKSRYLGDATASQISLKSTESFTDQCGSISDLGFVSGRNDVGYCRSLNELCLSEASSINNFTLNQTQMNKQSSIKSLNIGSRLGSLMNPMRWSKRNVSECSENRSRFMKKGPAARKCDRTLINSSRLSISPASSVFFLPSSSSQNIEQKSEFENRFDKTNLNFKPIKSGDRTTTESQKTFTQNDKLVSSYLSTSRNHSHILPSQLPSKAYC